MDPIRNPYAPGAGRRPPELAGRSAELTAFDIVLERVARGRSERSIVLTGLRGVGKTVLLNEIERLAIATGYRAISVEAHEDKPLAALLIPHLRKVLFDLDRLAGAGDKVRRGTSTRPQTPAEWAGQRRLGVGALRRARCRRGGGAAPHR